MVEYLRRFYDESLPEQPEDRWLLKRLREVWDQWIREMKAYKPFSALRTLRKFWVEDISRFYIKIKKGDKKEAPAALYKVLLYLLRMLEPFVPFTAEHLYQTFFQEKEHALSISLLKLDSPPQVEAPDMDTVKEIVESVRVLREKAGLKQRWPLHAIEPKVEYPHEYQHVILRLANALSIQKLEGDILENEWVRIPAKLNDEAYELAQLKEIIRRVQSMRKAMGLKEKDRALISIQGMEPIVDKYRSQIETTCNVSIQSHVDGRKQEWKTPFGPVSISIQRG